MSTKKPITRVELSDLERAKTLLVILEMQKRHHPRKSEFYWKPQALLAPLRDVFDMERAFKILRKETSGNVEAQFENVDLFDQESNSPMGLNQRRIFLRIKDDIQFKKDCKKILSKKDYLQDEKIQKIEILESSTDNRLRIFINENYANENIIPHNKGQYWPAFLEIARHGSIRLEKPRGIVDYFNSNRNNPLYRHSTCSLTEILTKDGGTISPLVSIKIVAKKGVTQRKGSRA